MASNRCWPQRPSQPVGEQDSFMLSHNHPSGSVTPSRADEHLTQTLKAALSLVDVRVLDHLVIAGNNALSFAETGLL